MKTINASDLGAFLYCRRAWWYQKQGTESENQAIMAAGTRHHHQHGQQVFAARFLRFVGWLLLLAGLVTLVLVLTMRLAGA
jgi:hypothetical protein